LYEKTKIALYSHSASMRPRHVSKWVISNANRTAEAASMKAKTSFGGQPTSNDPTKLRPR
jgi:hypothetical protein